MPDSYHSFTSTNKPTRYDTVMRKLFEIKLKQYESLKQLSEKFKREHPGHPMNSAFLNVLDTIKVYKYDIDNFLITIRKRKNETPEQLYERYQKVKNKPVYSKKYKDENGRVYYEFTPFLQGRLVKINRSSRGYITELITSLEVPNLTGHSIHIKEILTPKMDTLLLKNGFSHKNLNKLKSFELDVVFNNGYSWGEVKNYAKTFTRDTQFLVNKKNKEQEPPIEKLIFKAKLISKALKILRKHGYDIKMHYFFYNNGISKRLRHELESLDIIVEWLLLSFNKNASQYNYKVN